MFSDPLGLYSWSEFGYDAGQFAVGFGDVASLGITKLIRSTDWYGGDYFTNPCSTAYNIGEWTSVAAITYLGGALGAKAAGTKGAGLEFSHWIPSRWGGPRSIWNGNYVSIITHALSDSHRYYFMSESWRRVNEMPNIFMQQLTRIPKALKGLAIGATYAFVGKAINDALDNCECE